MFKLSENLTIAQVEECKSKLLDEIESNDTIHLDDSQVTRIDTVGIQLILAVITQISSQNKTLVWQPQSQAIKQSIKQLGLNEAILNQYLNA